MIVREMLLDYGDSGGNMPLAPAEGKRPSYPGLTEQEVVVLKALIALQKAPAQALGQRVGLPDGPILTAALDRLVR
jgi:hypothetical protein